MPAEPIDPKFDAWSGNLGNRLRIGGDPRASWSDARVPHSAGQSQFSLEQFRLYANLSVLPDRLAIYADEQVAPNGSQNLEAYVRYTPSTQGFYFKGGQFYLPFGWRLQDQTAVIRESNGISMIIPDKGLEMGYESTSWSAQLDFTNGAANATLRIGPSGERSSRVRQADVAPRHRDFGDSIPGRQSTSRRSVAGVKSGPVAWLAEADAIDDESFPHGRTPAAGLLEAG